MEEQVSKQNEPLKILVFSASLRKDSLNTALAKQAMRIIEKKEPLLIMLT